MKKTLSIILTLVLMLSALAVLGISASAEDGAPATSSELNVPTVTIPDKIPETLSEAGISTSELMNLFPNNLDATYENGVLKIKNIGLSAPHLISHYDYERYYLAAEGDCYTLELSEEAYDSGFTIEFHQGEFALIYSSELELSQVEFMNGSSDDSIYDAKALAVFSPEEAEINYYLKDDSWVCAIYRDDAILEVFTQVSASDYSIRNYYSFDGVLSYVDFSDSYNDYTRTFYLNGQGWSMSCEKLVPTDAPELVKDYTVGQLMALAPSFNLCEHRWADATCVAAKSCERCGLWDGESDPENHAPVDLETGLCACGQQLDARIGETAYPTFEAAFAAAKKGDTVVAYTGRSGGELVIPEGVLFDGGEHEFFLLFQNYGEIISGKYTRYVVNYGKISGGVFEHRDLEIDNYGEIADGEFNIYVEHHSGRIVGGTFKKYVIAYVDIDGGHFTESASVDFAADMEGVYHVVVNGGVFDCDLFAPTQIYGGEFNGEVINSSEIFGGVFNGEVINKSGKIYAGEFKSKVTNGVLDPNGNRLAVGFIYGGSFDSEIVNNKGFINNVADDYTYTLGEGFHVTDNEGTVTCDDHIKASDATCKEQAVCRICGSYGELAEHTWLDADCDSAKACDVCDATEGEALGHEFADATCTSPKTCGVCGATEGEALGHNYADATCTAPKTCSVCNAIEGEALGHNYADATTEAPKTCKSCGNTDGEPLHKPLPTPDEPEGEAVVGTPETPEEPNWFMKIINAIVDFFRKLFGTEKKK